MLESQPILITNLHRPPIQSIPSLLTPPRPVYVLPIHTKLEVITEATAHLIFDARFSKMRRKVQMEFETSYLVTRARLGFTLISLLEYRCQGDLDKASQGGFL